MSAQGTAPADDSERNPNDATGVPTGAKSSPPSSGVAATPQQQIKPKPKLLRDEIFETLMAKTIEATHGLKPLMLPPSVLEKATENAVSRKTNSIMAATLNYARNSASASKFTSEELLDEVLVAKGITPRKPRRAKPAKKNPKQNKKGGRHGNKS